MTIESCVMVQVTHQEAVLGSNSNLLDPNLTLLPWDKGETLEMNGIGKQMMGQ